MRKPCAHVRASSYTEVDAVEQRSEGQGGQEPQDRGGFYERRNYSQAPSNGDLQCWCSRGGRRFGIVAGAFSGRCGHARAV
jgi:hypothetical protein